MKLTPLPVAGAFQIDIEPIADERGFFARTVDCGELRAAGLASVFPQQSISSTRRRGTIRGLHFQATPHEEAKLVRCTQGAIYDVIVDLRDGSPTFRSWCGLELTAGNYRSAYVPAGCAHGLQVLHDDTDVLYLISVAFSPGSARGLRFDDPAFAITWPIAEPLVSPRDLSWAPFRAPTGGSA